MTRYGEESTEIFRIAAQFLFGVSPLLLPEAPIPPWGARSVAEARWGAIRCFIAEKGLGWGSTLCMGR